MHERYGFEGASAGMRVAGGTDRALTRAMLARAGASGDDAQVDEILALYLGHLAVVLRTRRYRPIGDVVRTVEALRARGTVVGLATGNVRDAARLKLASAGLEGVFDFSRGAFGCDAEPRHEIVRLAADRCAADRDGRVVVVVGDTERDVLAGRAIGARVVGVAADDASRAELRDAGADAIVDECGEDLVRAVFAFG